MAMINDKGPEESRDTDATYIILSHQSVHLPGPSRQEAGKVGGAVWWGGVELGGGGLSSLTEELLACEKEREEKENKKEKQVTKR